MTEASQGILEQVREAAAKHILFLPHALSQMNTPEELIATGEVREVSSFMVWLLKTTPRMRVGTVV